MSNDPKYDQEELYSAIMLHIKHLASFDGVELDQCIDVLDQLVYDIQGIRDELSEQRTFLQQLDK